MTDIEKYANDVADTVRQIILDNCEAQEITIDKIKVGLEQSFVDYTTKGEKAIRRYERENNDENL